MRVEITNRCSAKYAMLIRLYCGMTAFTALCASIALGSWRFAEPAALCGALCAAMCLGALVIPLRFGRISYVRSGACLRVEKGLMLRRTIIVNRSDIRCSEIRHGPLQRRLGLCTVVFFTGSKQIRLRGINTCDGRLLNRTMCG